MTKRLVRVAALAVAAAAFALPVAPAAAEWCLTDQPTIDFRVCI